MGGLGFNFPLVCKLSRVFFRFRTLGYEPTLGGPLALLLSTVAHPTLPFPSLRTGPLNPAKGFGEHCKLPSGVCGPAEIEFGAF